MHRWVHAQLKENSRISTEDSQCQDAKRHSIRRQVIADVWSSGVRQMNFIECLQIDSACVKLYNVHIDSVIEISKIFVQLRYPGCPVIRVH